MANMDDDSDSDYPGTEAALRARIEQMRAEIKECEHTIEYNEGEIYNVEEELARRATLPDPEAEP